MSCRPKLFLLFMRKEVKKDNDVRGGEEKGTVEERGRRVVCFNVMPDK